jgi:hypothetical protein
MDEVASQIRLQAARASGDLRAVRAAMARAAVALQRVEATLVMTAAGRAARATGPTLRPQRRRTRRYAERH